MKEEQIIPSVDLERIVNHSLAYGKRSRQSRNLDEVLLYCSKGHGELVVNDQSFTFQANDVFFIRPHELFHLIPKANMNIEYWKIHFNWQHNSGNFLKKGLSIMKVVKYQQVVQPLIEGLIRATDFNGQLNSFSAQLLENILQLIHKELELGNSEDSVDEYSAKIRRVVDYIHENYSQNPSISTLARLVDLEPSYFIRRFHKEVGMSPGKYCLNKRLCKAEILIKNTEIPLQSISKTVGFRNYNYFSRQFKQKYERSPKSYRNHYNLTTTLN